MRPADDPQVVAARLRSLGAHRGAAQVLFNAAAQAKAAQGQDGLQWTLWGLQPASPREPAPHLHASNDHDPAPLQPSDGVA